MIKVSRLLQKSVVLSAVFIEALSARGEKTPLETKIAQKHRIFESDGWGGGHRIIFDFGGRRGWIVEPVVAREDRPWCWTMQWMGAFLNRTGAPDLVKRGFFHVHLEAFDTKCDETGLEALAAFQRYLVEELGFAPKANLIGMSWGGFYSIRYAARYPENVRAIYLDAPLLDFNSFDNKGPGPWAKLRPADGNWSADPRMPVNLAEPVARAGIPILLLYGGADTVVNPKENCETFVPRFKAAGGDITVIRRGAYAHHPHGFEAESLSLIVDFFGGRRLLWSDEFDGTALDTNRWSRCEAGKADWMRNMSLRPDLVEVKDGQLVLWGVANSDTNADPRACLTGGVMSQHRGLMHGGKVQIRAKLEDHQKGAWPALWMLGDKPDSEGRSWPWNGEIDIIERLNGDPFVYHTAHTAWTYLKEHHWEPTNGGKGAIRPGDWNVYELEIEDRALVWRVNGTETFRYEKNEACGDPSQWPFDCDFYFLLDMQLGGKWVGEVDLKTLPVRMYIDWIRVYE